MNILVGTAGFSYQDWEGIVYPPEVKKRQVHPLQYLAQFFDCCEINTSFYGHIRPEVGRDWCTKVAAVNRDFLLTAKLYQGFTHVPKGSKAPSPFMLTVPAKEEKLAREGLDSIANEGKLGAVLIQFPISFKNQDDTRDYLFALIARFRQYPLALEIRHESWNDPEILGRLAAKNVAFCNIDQPRLGKSISDTEHVTAPVGYVRLHGRNYKEWFQSDNRNDRYNYLYKRSELEGWEEKIKNIDRQAEKTFAITNNHYKGQAAVNALELKNLLTGERLRAPRPLLEHYRERLEDIAQPV